MLAISRERFDSPDESVRHCRDVRDEYGPTGRPDLVPLVILPEDPDAKSPRAKPAEENAGSWKENGGKWRETNGGENTLRECWHWSQLLRGFQRDRRKVWMDLQRLR
jgi:hypothetical protein